MHRFLNKLKDESANSLVECVIILPIILIIIFAIIMTMFIIHDRSTIEAAARRGAIYASHCVSDPNYATITKSTGDLDVAEGAAFSFTRIGKSIDAYRYITGGDSVQSVVSTEVTNIVNKTRIPWRPSEKVTVSCDQKNYFIYQDIEVTVSSNYSLPAFFAAFGLETNYKYSATAKIAANDPDEFIRNADLVVDLFTSLDEILTGGKAAAFVSKITDKIGLLTSKIDKWTNPNQ